MLARARGASVIAITAVLALAGCGGSGEPSLMNLRSSDGPDEFAIVPLKALEMPGDLALLPVPTPGGENRTDRRPIDEAVVALGGNPAAGNPAADGALLAHAARNGREAGIRGTLAAEDLEWRRDNRGRVLERLFNVNVYHKAYSEQQLDQHAELEYWRKRGLPTPSAPPETLPEDK